MRSGIATQLSGAMLVSLFSAAWLAADGPCHFMVPAPSRSGPKPTLELNKSEIHPGETVNASGVVQGDFSYVRVAWVWDLDNDGAFESMRTAAVVPLLRGGSYSADIVAPRNPSSGTWTGRLRVGAVVVGAEDADFALADVTLTPAPPGGVSGKVPAEALGEGTITLSLFDPLTSKLVAATTAAEDGSFSFTDIAAGTYRLALSGDLATWVEPEDSEVKVASSEVTDVLLDAMFCGGYSPGTFGVTANDRISYVTADPTAMTDYHLATTWDDLGYGGIVNTSDVFGAYVEKTSADGDALTVTFSAYVQIVGEQVFAGAFR